MAALAAAARRARDALVAEDHRGFAASVDQTFDLRRRLMALDGLCVEMVDAARSRGASANYTGSGGAIVAVCKSPAHADEVAEVLGGAGCGVAQYP
jgi:glucuronokinase